MSDESSKSTLRRVFETVGYSLWTLFAGFGLPALLLITILGILIHTAIIDRPTLDDPVWTLILFAGQYLLGLGALLLLPVVIQRLPRERLKLVLGIMRRPTLKDVGMAIVYFAIYILTTTLILALVQSSMPHLDLNQRQDVGFDNVTNIIGLVAAFIALVIMAPVAEELIFRGYLFGNTRPLVGVVASIVITSSLFGLVHGQLNVGIDVAVLSIFLCLLRIKTGSIWAGIFLHMSKNALAYYLLFIHPLLGFTELMKYLDK